METFSGRKILAFSNWRSHHFRKQLSAHRALTTIPTLAVLPVKVTSVFLVDE